MARSQIARIARTGEEASRHPASGPTYKEIADALDVDGFRSASGKPWSEDGHRDLLKKAMA